MMSGMAWDIIGMIAVGIGVAAVVYAASHALRKLGVVLPRWIMPAAIGLGMLVFTIWNEYSWYSRVTGQLPDTIAVLETGSGGKAWRPWSFVVPVVNRFADRPRRSQRRRGRAAARAGAVRRALAADALCHAGFRLRRRPHPGRGRRGAGQRLAAGCR